ncbi:MAG TPA: DGQHR domain-containing protein DpdB [Polyangia bacterium]|nr:DGQHR domain-containing protein DpdB [Polyangia bacterium]
MRREVVVRSALRVHQNTDLPLYLLTLTTSDLEAIAGTSRIGRDRKGKLIGYQRAQVRRHIRNIVDYLDSERPLFPSSLVLALPKGTRFRPLRGARSRDRHSTPGVLEMRVSSKASGRALIVDGQQRAAALAQSRRKDFPVPVSAFVAEDLYIQREQFLRVNSTKPLPRGLITELLPEVQGTLPPDLAAQRIPSVLCEILNTDRESPFRGLIRRASSTAEQRRTAVIADTSLIRMLRSSFASPSGCLFSYRNLSTGDTDIEGARLLLLTYWNAVRGVFPSAWGRSPIHSRLMHSGGLSAMGRLMDRIMMSIDPRSAGASRRVKQELQKVAPLCRWTSGEWTDLGRLRWCDFQNVPSQVRMISDYLVRSYLQADAA